MAADSVTRVKAAEMLALLFACCAALLPVYVNVLG